MNKEHFALKVLCNITVSQRLEQNQGIKQHFCPLICFTTAATSSMLTFHLKRKGLQT